MERERTGMLVRKAVDIVGSQSKLARLIGVKQQHIWNWMNRDKQVPARYAPLIEEATFHDITRYELRPDIFVEEIKREED